MIILQSQVTRSETIRLQLSNLSWSRGVSNFFLEDIPYAFSSGKPFSYRMSQLVMAMGNLMSQRDAVSFRLCEIGSGLGLFPQFVVNYLRENSPDLYEKVHFLVTEYSQTMVDEFYEKLLFFDDSSKFTCRQMDFLTPNFKSKEWPNMIFLNYVLDAMPARHIEIEDGQIYEIRVTTYLDDDTVIIDHSTMPPQCLSSCDIQDLVLGEHPERQLLLSRRLISVLKESFHRIPIDELDDMSLDEKEDLGKFVDSFYKKGKIRFNYSYCFKSVLSSYFEKLPQDSMMLIYDFGYLKSHFCPSEKNMMTAYGVTLFYSLCFDYLVYWSKNALIHPINICYNEGQSQLMVMYKGNNVKEISDRVLSIFPDIGFENENRVVNRIKDIKRNDPHYMKKIEKDVGLLNLFESESYYLLINIALVCLEHLDPEHALEYIHQSFPVYERIGVPSYMLMGRAYMLLKEYDKAEAYFLKIFKICPNYPLVYYELSILYGKQKRIQNYVDLPMFFLNYLELKLTWNFVVARILIYLQLNKPIEASKLVDFIRDVASHRYVDVPKNIVDQVISIEQQFINVP